MHQEAHTNSTARTRLGELINRIDPHAWVDAQHPDHLDTHTARITVCGPAPYWITFYAYADAPVINVTFFAGTLDSAESLAHYGSQDIDLLETLINTTADHHLEEGR